MQRILRLISAAMLIASPGFTKTLITAHDYAADSDVVLESAVREVKSVPRDTIKVVGDTLNYVADETVAAAEAAASFFKTDVREAVVDEGMDEIAEAWDDSDEVLFRAYVVNDQMDAKLKEVIGEDAGASVDVSEFFEGVKFGWGTSALYRPELKRLFVQQTMENMLEIEYLLADHQGIREDLMGHQVEIEVKFVEVSQSTLDELGFSWTFGQKGTDNGGAANIFENLVFPGQGILSDALRTGATALNAGVNPSSLVVAKTAGSLRWGLLISALEQAEDTDVLSAPRLVTLDGEKATIEVGEERMVPKAFDADSVGTSVFIQHTDWENELMGVTLEVTPEIRSDDLIDLELKPKVVDLLGYDSYQVTPSNARMRPIQGQPMINSMNVGRYPIPFTSEISDSYNIMKETLGSVTSLFSDDPNDYMAHDQDINMTGTANSNPYSPDGKLSGSSPAGGFYDTRRPFGDDELIPVPSLHGQLPYFRIREMETQVTVADGSTIGMGGLIYDKKETYRDKVPVLGSIPFVGRLFRSEGERSIKRNLMIFVTATQVDVNGRRASDLALKQ